MDGRQLDVGDDLLPFASGIQYGPAPETAGGNIVQPSLQPSLQQEPLFRSSGACDLVEPGV